MQWRAIQEARVDCSQNGHFSQPWEHSYSLSSLLLMSSPSSPLQTELTICPSIGWICKSWAKIRIITWATGECSWHIGYVIPSPVCSEICSFENDGGTLCCASRGKVLLLLVHIMHTLPPLVPIQYCFVLPRNAMFLCNCAGTLACFWWTLLLLLICSKGSLQLFLSESALLLSFDVFGKSLVRHWDGQERWRGANPMVRRWRVSVNKEFTHFCADLIQLKTGHARCEAPHSISWGSLAVKVVQQKPRVKLK